MIVKKVYILTALRFNGSQINIYKKVPDTFQLKDDVDDHTTFVDLIYQAMQSYKIDECPNTNAESGERPAKKK